jgi:hypothetical protein
VLDRGELFDIDEGEHGPGQAPAEAEGERAGRDAARAGRDSEGGISTRKKYQGVRGVLKSIRKDIREGRKPVSYNTSFDGGVLGLAPSRVIVLGVGAGTGKTSLGMSCLFDVLQGRPAMRAVVPISR